MSSGFSGSERAKLTGDLREELHSLVHEHGRIAGLTVAEVIGVLEIIKHELLLEQALLVGDDD